MDTFGKHYFEYIARLPENIKDTAISLIQHIGTMCEGDYGLATDYVRTLLRRVGSDAVGYKFYDIDCLFRYSPYREITSEIPNAVIIDTVQKANPEMSERGINILTKRLNELRTQIDNVDAIRTRTHVDNINTIRIGNIY
jgi:hypothetical protein